MFCLPCDKKLNNIKGIFSSEKRNLMLISFFQVALNILDLFGVAKIGYIGAQSMNQISGIHNSNFFDKILLPGTIGKDPKTIMGLFKFVALLIIVIKTLISMKITKNFISKYSNKSAIISSKLNSSFLLKTRSARTKDNISEKFFVINEGVDALLLGVIAKLLEKFSDISLK